MKFGIALVLLLRFLAAHAGNGQSADPDCSNQVRMKRDTEADGTFWASDNTGLLDKDIMESATSNYVTLTYGMRGPFHMLSFRARVIRVASVRVSCHGQNDAVLYEEEKELRDNLSWRKVKFTDTFEGCWSVQARFNKIPDKQDMWLKGITMVGCRVTCNEISVAQPLNMSVENSDVPWGSGTEITFSCATGYRLVGAEIMICLTNGEWSDFVPYCERIVCSFENDDPNIIMSANHIDSPPLYGTGTIVEFTCPHSYAMAILGVINYSNFWVITCEEQLDFTGAWDKEFPTCEVIICPNEIPPINSFIDVTWSKEAGQWAVDTTIAYACDHGYLLIGDDFQTCTQVNFTGEWDFEQPSCQRLACDLYTVSDSRIITTEVQADPSLPYATGTQVFFSCPEGYFIDNGDPSMTCEHIGDSGTWVGTIPVCTRHSCPALSDPANGQVNVAWGPDGPNQWTYLTCVTFTCDGTTYLSGTSSFCCGDNGWESAIPECLPVSCGTPPSVPNGALIVNPGNPAYVGDCYTYQCGADYFMAGGAVICCQKLSDTSPLGQWSADPPECIYKYCPQTWSNRIEVDNVTHGAENWGPGTAVSLSCPVGYKLSSSGELECMVDSDGTRYWSPIMPRCEDKLCNPPVLGSPGLWSPSGGDWRVGKCFTAYCNDQEFELVGNSEICCEDNLGVYEWNVTEPTCERKVCTPRVRPLNGFITVNHQFDKDWGIGTVVSYTCNTGYDISGEGTVRCIYSAGNGIWNNPAPECNLPSCPAPAGLVNGDFDVVIGDENYYVGACVEFSCTSGYVIDGVAFSCCFTDTTDPAAGPAWSPEFPTCVSEVTP